MNETTELKEMTLRQLVDLYNEITGNSLKKFKDKPTAIARVEKAQDEQREQLDREIAAEINGEVNAAPLEEAPTTKGRGRIKFDDTDILVANQFDNPKRPGTKAHANFQMCLDFVGYTIAEFREAGGSLRELNYNVEREFFCLEAKEK